MRSLWQYKDRRYKALDCCQRSKTLWASPSPWHVVKCWRPELLHNDYSFILPVWSAAAASLQRLPHLSTKYYALLEFKPSFIECATSEVMGSFRHSYTVLYSRTCFQRTQFKWRMIFLMNIGDWYYNLGSLNLLDWFCLQTYYCFTFNGFALRLFWSVGSREQWR